MQFWKGFCLIILFTLLACTTQPHNSEATISTTLSEASSTPIPFPTAATQFIRDPKWAIEYSYSILLHRKLEPVEYGYESADYAAVRFPDDTQGVLVIIGITGVPRGYKFLYRIRGELTELVEVTQDVGTTWGVWSIDSTRQNLGDASIAFLDIFARGEFQKHQVVKITGARHPGTGLADEGCFEILLVTNDGLMKVFSGTAFSTNSTTFDTYCEHRYTDLDDDGNSEIIEECKRCEYRYDPETWEKKDLGCETNQTVYGFDGTRYASR